MRGVSGQQEDPIGELPALIEAGVPTFKAFMVYDFRLPDDDLFAAMRTAGRHGGMLQVHCEEPGIIDPLVADALRRGQTSCRYHALTRPSRAEGAATRKAIEMARRAEAPLYIVHLSCDEALEAVAEAKQRGEPVHAETCPHYLAFTDARYGDKDEAEVIKSVISPPLRSRADVDALWAGLRDGVLDIVGSDHVPDRLDTEKRVPAPPFPEISNGGPGIETLLAVVYSEGVATGRIGIERMVDVLATTPARRFGLPSKGAIEVGRDADLVIWDPGARRTLRQADLHHTSDFTPYEGMEVNGGIAKVVVGGHSVGEATGTIPRASAAHEPGGLTQPMRCGGRPTRVQRPTLRILALALLLAACGADQVPDDPGASAGPVVGDWVLTGGSIDGVDAAVLEDHRITLTIAGSRISGAAACNTYGGDLVMRADGLHIDNLAQTAMACEEPAMSAETTYLGALGRVREIARDGDELVAGGDGIELRFSALQPPPTAELIGTTWVLDTVLVGDVAASPIGEATLELKANGTFTGSTGCRRFQGEWIEQGDQIVAPSWSLDHTECPADVSAQDEHVVSVIGDGFIPTIEGNLLTLLDPGGVGLVYRAGD